MVFTFTGSFALTMRSSESQLTPKTLLYLPAGEAHSNIFGSQGAGVFVTSIDPAWIGDRLETVSADGKTENRSCGFTIRASTKDIPRIPKPRCTFRIERGS
jgi:hypothetical protein